MEDIKIINELSEFFKVFSDTTRLRILEVLLEKEPMLVIYQIK